MAPATHSVLVVTGETSGEHHAAGLIREVSRKEPHLKWFGSGGSHMAAEGVDLLFDVARLAAIGPWEAVTHLKDYWTLYRRILGEVKKRKPCLAVLVDFPEFNLNLARRLKSYGVPICYFIGPQVWAWRSSRLRQIRRFVDLMLVILPFEETFYRRHGIEAHYVGNPAVALGRYALGANGFPRAESDVPVVALLPGSRRREVEHIFPIELDAARAILESRRVEFWAIKAPDIEQAQLQAEYEKWVNRGNPRLPLRLRTEEAVRLLPKSSCAVVKSGTSTLEATILQVPFAMVYRLSWPSWYLARGLVTSDTYCLANLIAGKRIVPEFVQGEATGEKIAEYVLKLLDDRERWEKVRNDLEAAAGRLGEQDAYVEAARCVDEFLKDRTFLRE